MPGRCANSPLSCGQPLPWLVGFSGFDAAAQLPAPAEGGRKTHEGQRSWRRFVNGLIDALGEDLMASGCGMGAIPVEPVPGRITRVGGTISVVDAPGCHVREAKYGWVVEDFLLDVVGLKLNDVQVRSLRTQLIEVGLQGAVESCGKLIQQSLQGWVSREFGCVADQGTSGH